MKHIVILIGLFISCNSAIQAFQIELKEITAVTKAGNLPFLGVDGMTVRGSSIFLVDRVMQRVAVLNDNDLSLRKDYNGSGQSDASLLMPGFIATTSQYIFVADYGKFTIRVFSNNFKYITKIVVDGGIFGIATDKDENLWVAAVTLKEKQSIKKIDLSGNVLAELFLVNATGNHMDLYYSFCIDKDNYFYVAYFTKNCVEVIHPEKGFIRQFMVPGLPGTVPWSKIKKGLFQKDFPLPEGVIFSSIATDNKGRLYLMTGDYSETPFREVDICSTDGKFLSWCVLKDASQLISIDNNDRLVSIEGTKNKVRIYELKNIPNR